MAFLHDDMHPAWSADACTLAFDSTHTGQGWQVCLIIHIIHVTVMSDVDVTVTVTVTATVTIIVTVSVIVTVTCACCPCYCKCMKKIC